MGPIIQCLIGLCIVLSWFGSNAEMISVSDLSKCAAGCVVTKFPVSRCDSPTNLECVCAATAYQDAVAQCLQANCTVVDSLVAKRYFTQTCQVPVRDNSGVTRGVGWVLYTLTVICVAGRLLFRNPYCQGSGYGLDDWLIIVSLAILTPIVALVDEMTRHGLGQDIWMLTPQQISRILYVFWACEIMYAVLMATTKIAILMLYLRIWQAEEARNKRFRIACYALCCVMVCFAITFGLLFGLSCSPVSYAWERWDNTKEGTCLDVLATLFACAAINIVLDFMVCLLPIPKLTSLNISTPKKIGISFIFMLGLFVTICSIVRFNYLVKFAHSTNPSWDYQPIALWSCNECNLSVLCACLPAMAGLFQRLWRQGVSRYGSGSRSRGTHQGSGHQLDEVALTRIPKGGEQTSGWSLSRIQDYAGEDADKAPVVETNDKNWRMAYPAW